MKKKRNLVNSLLLIAGLMAVYACKKRNEEEEALKKICTYVPVYIDTVISVTDIKLMSLKTEGYAYLKGGYKGIIVFKVSDSEYKAFERASTYQMAERGCPLKVDLQSFCIRDTCSGSKFDFSGNVIQEPASCPLLQYHTYFIDGNRIRIFNGVN